MNLFHSIILGLIQGLTEFFPISSSGHLIIFPWLFGWGKHPLLFDVILHSGTLLALVIYFRKDLISLFRDRRLLWYIIIASIPAIIVGGIFEKEIESALRDPVSVAAMLGIFGLVLYAAELYGKKSGSLEDITLTAVIFIGVSQVFALIPGVSRSAVTISAALFLGMNRESSVRFSFLLGVPVIFAAACYSMMELFPDGLGGEAAFSWPAAISGFAVSFLSSIAAIHLLLRFVKRHPLTTFAVYRLVLSLFVIMMFLRN